jgi:hypothetical protein
MMLKRLRISVVIGVLVLVGGCIQKETSHTVYLSPDGAVSWVVSEVNVKSDQAEPGKRLAEEEDYIGPALLGSHGVARGLRALGPIGTVRTTVVRDRRPFHLVTQADFTAIDRLLSRFFREMGVRSTAAMLRDADRTTLRVRLDFAIPPGERDTAVSELFDQIEHLRFVLTEGRFNTADGLDVADGAATLSPEWLDQAERARQEKRVIEFVLTWSVD